jgi:hypothetical protein
MPLDDLELLCGQKVASQNDTITIRERLIFVSSMHITYNYIVNVKYIKYLIKVERRYYRSLNY